MNDMTNSLYQQRLAEERNITFEGQTGLQLQLNEKQKLLMQISDWATILKKENDRLSLELETSHKLLAEKDKTIEAFANKYRKLKWLKEILFKPFHVFNMR